MSSIFTKIIAGEIPGQFVWVDDVCVVMATIEPVRPGHVMVVPRAEVAKFNDVEPSAFAHMMQVAQVIASAQEKAFDVPRAIVSILGFEVPHTHVHVVPAESEEAAQFHGVQAANPQDIARAMDKLRTALVEAGYEEQVRAAQ
ncbi:HIT family protein [Trueperella pecoris]|uniref:HIT family protein n=1 Tax=Trueperella pecoris TaxID=2733571 RepID=A0A7M1QUJ7_9ACTO|nr:HIT family protein [Trueperella pecoris]QOQ38681.1 HIT family protein [Trueperella pecoris]QOR44827.1 HIT family protein [Trueperella pecoris]QTG74750.1 HIT family protein [Trueperella pecoris]